MTAGRHGNQPSHHASGTPDHTVVDTRSWISDGARMPNAVRRVTAGIVLFTIASVSVAAGPLSAGERQRVLAHLEMTEAWLLSELAGLSDAQLAYKMTPASWSIKEVVEHLAIAEPQYWTQLQDSLKQPLGYKSESTDAAILWYGIDRTNRTTTGEARVPTGQFTTLQASMDSFRKLRGTMTTFARDTQEDLRGRQLKGGNMDVYQWLLMISTHSQRHIMQIREIKAHGSYPK
jgi:hypothetical protein